MSVDESSPTLEEARKQLRDVPAVALVGFAEWWDPDNLRLYPDHAYQRWMEIPKTDIRAKAQYDDVGRTVVWVDRDSLNEPLFQDGTIEQLDQMYAGAPISTWALIPATRFVAADLLDLIAPYGGDEY